MKCILLKYDTIGSDRWQRDALTQWFIQPITMGVEGTNQVLWRQCLIQLALVLLKSHDNLLIKLVFIIWLIIFVFFVTNFLFSKIELWLTFAFLNPLNGKFLSGSVFCWSSDIFFSILSGEKRLWDCFFSSKSELHKHRHRLRSTQVSNHQCVLLLVDLRTSAKIPNTLIVVGKWCFSSCISNDPIPS